MNFYCQQVSGDANFSIDEWNNVYYAVKDLGLSKEAEEKILFESGEHCKEQCFACMAIVGETQLKNKNL